MSKKEYDVYCKDYIEKIRIKDPAKVAKIEKRYPNDFESVVGYFVDNGELVNYKEFLRING
jgi:hypothetical protein